MCLVFQFCINTLHIMVIHETIKSQTISNHIADIFNGMCHFKIVVLIMTGIQCFVKHIVCYGMKCFFIYPTRIIAMNYFSHEPELRLHFICHMTKSFHVVEIHNIRSIQTNSINVKLAYPKANHVTDIISDCRVVLIQFRKKVVASPVFIRKTVIE